jgi:nucleotide-binding universal stress UspA family protein
MHERILVGVTGGEHSRKALREAIALAREHRGRPATLRLVHVVDPTALGPDAVWTDPGRLRRELRAEGQGLLGAPGRAARAAGVPAEAALRDGGGAGAGRALVAEARRWRADLIVLGAPPRRGLAGLWLPSPVEAVARAAPAPVLLVTGAEEPGDADGRAEDPRAPRLAAPPASGG